MQLAAALAARPTTVGPVNLFGQTFVSRTSLFDLSLSDESICRYLSMYIGVAIAIIENKLFQRCLIFANDICIQNKFAHIQAQLHPAR